MTPDSAQAFGVALMAMWVAAGAVALGRSVAKSPAARELAAAVRRMNLAAKGALVAGLVGLVAIGGTKPGSNDPLRLGLRPLSAIRTIASTNATPFALVEVRTNGVVLLSASTNAIVSERIRRRGTSEGGEWIEADTPFFRWRTNLVSRVFASPAVLSFGTMRHPALGTTLPDGTPAESLVALRTPLGLVPEANGLRLAAPSRVWHETTPGGRVFTWENALLDRQADRPATIQIETRADGDFVYRYDFSDAAPTNDFFAGAQFGPVAVEALGVRGGVTNAATVYRVNGTPVRSGVSVADLFASPRLELRWKNVADLGDLSGDTDGDGLTDWDEIFRYDTDPNQSDTDGDGLSDAAEVLAGSNPLNADENGDGMPDGADVSSWTSDPIWGENAGRTNLVITLGTSIPDGATASLVLGSVTLPLRNARRYVFGIPSGVEVPFRLFSRGVSAVDLSMSNRLPEPPVRLLRSSSKRPQKEFNGPCLRLHDLLGVFDGKRAGGDGFVAEPRIYLRCESGDDDMVSGCIHGDGFCVYSIVTEPASCAFELHEADEIDGFQIQQGKFVSLHVTDTPGDGDYGYIRFGPKYHCWGDADVSHWIHRCEGGRHVWCNACGTYHADENDCSHEPDCAAVLDPTADCTCDGIYVHVAWQDADGNGTPDLADDHLVGGGDVRAFRALGSLADDCCCGWAHKPDGQVRIQSVSPNLRLWADAMHQLRAGDTGTVFTIQATAPSPSVGGSHIAYEIVGPSNNVLRTLHVPVTAWDIWDTGLSFNWATNAHSSDAINLRKDYHNPIDYTRGEWEKPRDHAAAPTRDEPACWIAGTRPTVMARFEIRPADIRSAALSAFGFGSIFSWIGETAVVFSNGVTKEAGPSPHPDYAAFAFALDVPSVVARSTNELWHWSATSINGHELPSSVYIATNGPSVAYSILGAPVAPWTDAELANTNVWVSSLEFVTKTNACSGASSKEMALSELTQYLFGKLGLHYDLSSGGPSFTDFTAVDWYVVGGSRPIFSATRYMNNVSSGSAGITAPASSVNCYDQAAALTTFGTMMGIDVRYRFLLPFGYINLTNLVGWGLCNNPIPGSCRNPNLIVGADDIFPNRSLFGNHAFCSYSGMAFDACAGPALGSLSVADYLEAAIDHSSSTTGSMYSETNSSICGVGKTPNLGFIKKLE